MADEDRLAGRNGAIWQAYVRGSCQDAIAARFGISQQRVSQVIKDVRDSIPEETKQEIVTREIELLYMVRTGVVEMFEQALEVRLRDPENDAAIAFAREAVETARQALA